MVKRNDNTIEMTKTVIDMGGPEGNHRTLMSYAHQLARKHNLDEEAITTEMLSGGFRNMVRVFDKHFGEWVILEK